jgi:hypothetical protein
MPPKSVSAGALDAPSDSIHKGDVELFRSGAAPATRRTLPWYDKVCFTYQLDPREQEYAERLSHWDADDFRFFCTGVKLDNWPRWDRDGIIGMFCALYL